MTFGNKVVLAILTFAQNLLTRHHGLTANLLWFGPSLYKPKEFTMERVHLGSVIEQAISRFSQNRIGEKPPSLS